MDTIKTATGVEYQCDYFNPCPVVNRLNIRLSGLTVTDAATIFSDPTETESLTYGDQCETQWTNLVAIMPEGNAIRVVLSRG